MQALFAAASMTQATVGCDAMFLLRSPALFAVVASEKGVVVGRLTFTEAGDHIDCRRMGVGGKAIPPNISKVTAAALWMKPGCCRDVGGAGSRHASYAAAVPLPMLRRQCRPTLAGAVPSALPFQPAVPSNM